MSCSPLRQILSDRPVPVTVNGVAIARDEIAREAQHHPAPKPFAAWQAAARALAIRELLLQEARRIGITAVPADDGEGRRETEEEAIMRVLIEREVTVPVADMESCRRYYDNNLKRFQAPGGEPLPFELVSAHIANYLHVRAWRTALVQYVARLVSCAEIAGVELDGADIHRVN